MDGGIPVLCCTSLKSPEVCFFFGGNGTKKKATSISRLEYGTALVCLYDTSTSTSKGSTFQLLPPSPKPVQKNPFRSLARYPPFHPPPTAVTIITNKNNNRNNNNNKNDRRDDMGSATYRNPAIAINRNVGNVTGSYKSVWNNCELPISV